MSKIIQEYHFNLLPNKGEVFDVSSLPKLGDMLFHGTSEVYSPSIEESGICPDNFILTVELCEEMIELLNNPILKPFDFTEKNKIILSNSLDMELLHYVNLRKTNALKSTSCTYLSYIAAEHACLSNYKGGQSFSSVHTFAKILKIASECGVNTSLLLSDNLLSLLNQAEKIENTRGVVYIVDANNEFILNDNLRFDGCLTFYINDGIIPLDAIIGKILIPQDCVFSHIKPLPIFKHKLFRYPGCLRDFIKVVDPQYLDPYFQNI